MTVEKWEFLEELNYFVSKNNVYCSQPVRPDLQSLHIFMPAALMTADGQIDRQAHCKNRNGVVYTAATIPIIFYNDIGGYAECEPAPVNRRNKRFLEDGYIVVSVGARGRQTKDRLGKAPSGLVDLKAAVRWLRQHQEELPGDTEKIISVGTSAGGAMSSLLGSTGNCSDYFPYLESIGSAMDQRDDVFAAQCYCPITNLEHADMAYEWMFQSKMIYTFGSSFAPQVLTEQEQVLSNALLRRFPAYVNSLDLGLNLGDDGRSGSFYQAILGHLSNSLQKFLNQAAETAAQKESLVRELDPQGLWSIFEEGQATVTDLDAYVLNYMGRMKGCPAFDSLSKESPEKEVFGTARQDYRHFSATVKDCLQEYSLFPEYQAEFERDFNQKDLLHVQALMNPMTALSRNLGVQQVAPHYRICLGGKDADTSFAVSYLLYQALKKHGIDAHYELIWGMGHCDADYREEFSQWVDAIVS